MFLSFWRGLWDRNSVASRRKCRRGGHSSSYRPRLEPLEDRTLPALSGAGAFASALLPGTLSSLPPTASRIAPFRVTVNQNAAATVIDLGSAFRAVGGLQHEDGLRLSILGNTNSALVKTNLSEAALTLTYVRWKAGTATITVCATDADGVSVQRAFLVTVRPPSPVVAVSR